MAEQTEASIEIKASRAAVMAVIADLPSYPQWSDGITSVSVLSDDPVTARPAEAEFRLESGPIKDSYVLKYEWDDDSSVSWSLVRAEMLKEMNGSYTLTENVDGGTTVVYRLAVDVKIPMIGMLKRKAERVIVDTALKGLKKRVEG